MSATTANADDPLARISELERELAAEREAHAQADAMARAMSARIAVVSHELRTPMGAIIAMADLLQSTSLTPGQRQYTSTLAQSARGLLTVLNDILDYSKLESGRFELDPVAFDLRELCQGVATALDAQTREKGLASGFEIAAACPDHVTGDPVRLRQVLGNLIDNAVKFTSEGSVHISVAPPPEAGPDVLCFKVTDTGPGLSEQKLGSLFEPYAQGDASVSGEFGGTGLGLFIARGLVELMGGTLGCDSAPGIGSSFWFTVALPEARAPAVERARGAAGASARRPLAGHVLVVEDNDVNQKLIAAYLDQFGLTFDIVANGARAVEAAATGGYDLVLMDVMLPGVDGIEATRRIRALPGDVALVPVIALTANALAGDRERYLTAGMNAYVAKPMDAGDLHDAIAAFLPEDRDTASL